LLAALPKKQRYRYIHARHHRAREHYCRSRQAATVIFSCTTKGQPERHKFPGQNMLVKATLRRREGYARLSATWGLVGRYYEGRGKALMERIETSIYMYKVCLPIHHPQTALTNSADTSHSQQVSHHLSTSTIESTVTQKLKSVSAPLQATPLAKEKFLYETNLFHLTRSKHTFRRKL
jgi:hypothetical protein